MAAIGHNDVRIIRLFVSDRHSGLDLRQLVNLGTFHGEANTAAQHEVIKQELEVFDAFDVHEVAVVQRCRIELLNQRGAQLPKSTTRERATKVEHVVKQLLCLLLGVRHADLDSAVNHALNRFWPCLNIPILFRARIGTQVDDFAHSVESPRRRFWGVRG